MADGLELSPRRCHRIRLPDSISLQWITPVGWSRDGRYFLIIGDHQNEILGIPLTGDRMRRWSLDAATVGSREVNLWEPMRLSPSEGGLQIVDRRQGRDNLGVARELRLVRPVHALGQAIAVDRGSDSEIVLARIHESSVLDSGILALGDVVDPAGGLESALLYSDEGGRFQVLGRVASSPGARLLYSLSTGQVTALDDTGYILFLDESPRIFEVRLDGPDPRELAFFPEQFRNRPRLDGLPLLDPRRATEIFRRQEATRMSVGLYAGNERLYLLGKEAMAKNGTTAWRLVALDPRDGTALSSVPLPTEAAHLSVLPGDDFWGLVERTPVEGVGKMHAPFVGSPSMVLLPTTWLEEPSGGPLLAESEINCTFTSKSP